MTDSAIEYGINISKDVMILMRDGVRLATDIYRPTRNGEPTAGEFPTILGRTSYDKNSDQMWIEPVANFFTPRGYVVVLQDLRGRHHSEGMGQYFHTANPQEGEDGYDTIEWIAEQTWSNGRVGMTGSSHGGIVQTAATLTRPPHLTTIWVDVAPTNIHAHEAREGGAMALHMFGALFLHAHDAQEIRDDPAATAQIIEAMENMRELIQSAPFKPGHTPLSLVPNLEKMLFHYYYEGEYNDFWAQECCDQARFFHKSADIPGVFSGGWYDPFPMATTHQFATMADQNATPQRLLMGPWNHGGMRGEGTSHSGDADFGKTAKFGDGVYNEARLRWFDRWLKDAPTGVDDGAPVRIFVMGGGTGNRIAEGHLDHGGVWRDEKEWPLARTRRESHYLQTGGGLSTEIPDSDTASISYTHDPENPVPTIGGNVTGFYELADVPEGLNREYIVPRARMRQIVLDGGAHQKEEPGTVGTKPPWLPLATRPDVLVFQTEPLEEGIEVTGSIEVNLWISSSAVDTDFTAKLVDVYPSSQDYPGGYHLNICDSIIRVRYRNGFDSAEFMAPGDVYQVQIKLGPTSNLFKAGQRIRLDIASSNFPRFDVNPNTGEPNGRHTHTIRALNTVHLDESRPSHVVLPIISTEQ
ncbi:MAG: CocE/NonD family hydrolase [SAR202 cluster bacterium]|nr:CocE/NonD family hydrolase [SAR202 cluster bacterium]